MPLMPQACIVVHSKDAGRRRLLLSWTVGHPVNGTMMFHCGKTLSCVQCLSFYSPPRSHGCYASVSMESTHSLYMQAARQTGRQLKFLRRGLDWLFIRQELWHHQSRKSGPRGNLALRKMKRRVKRMKYAWRLYLSQLPLLYAAAAAP